MLRAVRRSFVASLRVMHCDAMLRAVRHERAASLRVMRHNAGR